MALTKRSESNTVFLQAKHFCLWQELKSPVAGCEEIKVTNPRTGEVLTKYGFRYNTVTGHVVACEKYDTGDRYGTRYVGFKLRLRDGMDSYSLDMPYQGQMLRRFLRVAPAIDWDAPISISVFRGKGTKGDEQMGVWFQQRAETIRPYFTRENPRGMPAATQDPHTQEWDFRGQHRWLVVHLMEHTLPAIEAAAERFTPPERPHAEAASGAHEPPVADQEPFAPIDDDDVPF